jgi:hypothetical protein
VARRGTDGRGEVQQANFKEINMEVMKAEALAEERKLLEKIANKNGGLLMVDDVLDEARNPKSILHKHFQWDDDKAAEAYRKMQARQLIQKCVVTIEKAPDVPIRAFVSLSTDQYEGGGYRLTANVLSDEQQKGQLLHDMHLTLLKWKKQVNLLDTETEEILDRLERVITRRVSDRRGKEIANEATLLRSQSATVRRRQAQQSTRSQIKRTSQESVTARGRSLKT